MQAPQLIGSDLGSHPRGKDPACTTDTNHKATWGTDETSVGILAIIFDYALDKFDDSRERLASGMINFLSIIDRFVMAEKPVDMCLPGFPFKSANKINKVLGFLPDKAEELALQRLDTMCLHRDTWAYGEALRALAVKKGFNQITFSRLKDLAGLELPEKMSEIVYVANATNFRRYLLNKYGKEDYDINYEIATNPDTLMTYCGYKRFLESDLQHIFPTGENRSHNGYRRDVKYLAKEMMIRGCAFAGAIKAAFPNHLRLSIHQSTGEHKVSLSLLHTKTGYTTPWHCCVALMANGEWLSAPMSDFQNDPCFDIVYEDGRPSYFREKLCRSEDRK
ncbi:transferase family [Fusarium pseudocircinatum]|uniref:Transferase family n=1 Tax=Fusarium pseudocircinatum TaxID=56676 RepID=A0A8H5PLE8_9HYPO|nr:transferase family [Fusarium pseudocircinatum]